MATADNYEQLSGVGSGEVIRVHIPWFVPVVAHLYIWLKNNATGELKYNTLGDFTIDPAPDLSYVDVMNPYWDEETATGEEVTVYTLRLTDLAQTYAIPPGPLNPRALIAQFDKVARQIQELVEKVPREDFYPVLGRLPYTWDDVEGEVLQGIADIMPVLEGWILANPGPPGPQGVQGDQGDQGIQGPEGPEGERGLKGDQGDQGIQGVAGAPGDEGAEGPAGPKGDTGESFADALSGESSGLIFWDGTDVSTKKLPAGTGVNVCTRTFVENLEIGYYTRELTAAFNETTGNLELTLSSTETRVVVHTGTECE